MALSSSGSHARMLTLGLLSRETHEQLAMRPPRHAPSAHPGRSGAHRTQVLLSMHTQLVRSGDQQAIRSGYIAGHLLLRATASRQRLKAFAHYPVPSELRKIEKRRFFLVVRARVLAGLWSASLTLSVSGILHRSPVRPASCGPYRRPLWPPADYRLGSI